MIITQARLDECIDDLKNMEILGDETKLVILEILNTVNINWRCGYQNTAGFIDTDKESLNVRGDLDD